MKRQLCLHGFCLTSSNLSLIVQLPGCSLFWRSVLQVILHQLTGDTREDWQVGKIAAKCDGFTPYVYKALAKLNISHEVRIMQLL